ncbi:hypothetical protein [Cellulomonas hominis]|uniref:hypothetical protein n=1 Tax=Cellulomonas hominis TaxID=156981 RepID=UPI001B9D0641|nr:hypothetical protein [Cellulomonas hominis]VTR75678.1 hypothetical protein CHMI_00430 [Cellulomonas hominis]
MNPRQISRIDLRLPRRWCGWRPGDGLRAAHRAADALTAGPVAAARLRSALEAVDRVVAGHGGRPVRAGAWVPDPSGDVVAGLACELLADVPAGPDAAGTYLDLVRRRVRRSHRTPTRVGYHAVTRRDLPAGPAVVALRSHGAHRHEVVWTVFPPGAAEAVELRFDTLDQDRYPHLVDAADGIAQELRVTLTAPSVAGASAGRPGELGPR